MKKVATILCFFICCSAQLLSQELHQIDSKWEIRNSQNDPNIDGDFSKVRINFGLTEPTYFVFGSIKSSKYPTSVSIERSTKFTDLILTVLIQTLKENSWRKSNIDFYINKWGEAITRDEKIMTDVFSDFLFASKVRLRLAIEGEDWTEFSQASFVPVASKLFAPPKVVKDEGGVEEEKNIEKKSEEENKEFAGLSMEFPERGIYLGLSKNAYVKQLKKFLALPQTSQNGTYDVELKNAVAIYFKENNVTDVKQDGSVVTYELYLKILDVDENGTPLNSSKRETKLESNQVSPQAQAQKISQIVFPIYLGQGDVKDGYDPATWGRYIVALQRAVKAETTGILDKQTFDSVKKFINDPKKKRFFTEPLDEDSKNVLENKNRPGVTSILYNTIIRTNDLIILHNRNATRPEDRID